MQYPVKHLSIRVPWHDIGWEGNVCQKPNLNSSCLILDRLAPNKVDAADHCLNYKFTSRNWKLTREKNAGISINDLDEERRPACMGERMAFMAPFDYHITINYPYTYRENLNHFLPTMINNPPYSASGVPFNWMSKRGARKLIEDNILPVDMEQEKKFERDNKIKTEWINTLNNQKMIMDWFFDHVKPQSTLCFFYAKKVPFCEDQSRVILGVGRLKQVDPYIEYDYSEEREYRGIVWERSIHHSIRPGFEDGFILPYHQAMKMAEENPDLEFDPSELAVIPPSGKIPEFSYVTEHVSNDTAIDVLLACAESLKKAIEYGIKGSWENSLRWINEQLAELWKMRGPYPGMGSALSALGFSTGNFIAMELENQRQDDEDPWELMENIFNEPENYLSANLAAEVKDMKDIWEILSSEEKDLLKLISRFEISILQASIILLPEIREKLGLHFEDGDILKNPYLIYEFTRHTEEPVGFLTVDHGVLPDLDIRNTFPLPEQSRVESEIDWRRIRALTVELLEEASYNGHSLLPRNVIIERINEMQMVPPCKVNEKIFRAREKYFEGIIEVMKMANEDTSYQLSEINEIGQFIRIKIQARKNGKRIINDIDWEDLLFSTLEKEHESIDKAIDPEMELKARNEKAAALREIAESRVSVLLGSAGTGKTTLLSILCQQEEIRNKGILLLAPTGKARVRMEQALGLSSRKDSHIKAYNVAQFLVKSGRYDGVTHRFILNGEPPKRVAGTVIIDEASMLTEQMLAALLESMKGYDRLILVGDRFQLPPIGTGRPFVDIITELKPENIDESFPRVGPCYAELTQNRRQTGTKRADIQMASWFRGGPVNATEDEIFDILTGSKKSEYIDIYSWEDPEEFKNLIFDILTQELELEDEFDYRTFNNSFGAFNGSFRVGSAEGAENWQILSPVRNRMHGVTEINRMIHQRFKGAFARKCRHDWKKPDPAGIEGIVWGDKVINIRNQSLDSWNTEKREKTDGYLANGEIGILVETPRINNKYHLLKFEFSSQPGFTYSFFNNLKPMGNKYYRMDEDDGPSLELAYALTIHKAQGSEFGKVILVIPRNSFTISRELIYTALTRQKDGIVILYEGDPRELMNYSDNKWSETDQRFTNIFQTPHPRPVKDKKDLFLEDRLINRTLRGEDVRSKSELIIANMLHSNDIDYEYEPVLEINGETRRPDFVIYDDDSGETYYWEHLGMCTNKGYRNDWKRKEQWYRKNDILPHKEGGGKNGVLLTTRDTKKGGINSEEIENVVKIVKGELD